MSKTCIHGYAADCPHCDHLEAVNEDQVRLFAVFTQTGITIEMPNEFYGFMDGPEKVVEFYIEELAKLTGKKFIRHLATIQHVTVEDLDALREARIRLSTAKQQVLHASNEVELARQALKHLGVRNLGVTDVR